MRINLTLIIIFAVFLRLVLAFSTFHPDIAHFALSNYVISKGHLLDFYDYLPSLVEGDPIIKSNPKYAFNYPPLIYLTHGFFGLILSPFIDTRFSYDFLINQYNQFGNLPTNVYLLVLKLPYLVFDLMIGWFIYKKLESPEMKRLGLVIWLFNPVNLHSTYMMGQFDVIPVFFMVGSLYFATQKRLALAALFLGFGAAFKIFPLLLVLPLILLSDNLFGRIKLVILSLIPYILSLGLFINSEGFRTSALVANQTLKSLYAQIPVSGGEAIILFPTVLIVIYLYFIFSKNIQDLWSRYLIILLVFFVFTHTHPQWFLWLTPLLILDLIRTKFYHLPLVVIVFGTYLGQLFLFEASLTVGLIAPIFPNFATLPSIWQIVGVNLDVNFSRSVLQSIFTGTALYYLYFYLSRRSLNETI